MSGYNPAAANKIGHLTLVLASVVSALAFRGIPLWLWVVVYVISAFAAPAAWRERDLDLTEWFVLAVVCYGFTVVMYLIFSGHSLIPVAKAPGVAGLIFGLVSFSGFARALYLRCSRTAPDD